MATNREREPVIRISPSEPARAYWARCWEYRELLWFLARRDLLVRYRQTVAGVLWLLMKPAAQVVIYTVLFGVLAAFPSDGLPYPVVAMAGVTAWTLFAAIVNESTIALTNNINLVTKVHFPRILLPLGTVAPNLVDLLINVVALLGLMLWYGLMPSWRILLLPVPIALVAAFALGLGAWFSAGCVRYRDFRQLAPFVLNALYMLSPVGFSSGVVHERLPEAWVTVFYANPLASAIDLFRWCVQPAGHVPAQDLTRLLVSLSVGAVLLISGQWYFRRSERTFADVI